MVIPLLLVIITAVKGFNTFICIGSGLVSSYILGLFAGTTGSLMGLSFEACMDAFSDAGSWVIVMMMWIAGFGGVMREMDAFAPLAAFIVKFSRKVRHMLTWNALLSFLGNAVLADEMAQIVTVSGSSEISQQTTLRAVRKQCTS